MGFDNFEAKVLPDIAIILKKRPEIDSTLLVTDDGISNFQLVSATIDDIFFVTSYFKFKKKTMRKAIIKQKSKRKFSKQLSL